MADKKIGCNYLFSYRGIETYMGRKIIGISANIIFRLYDKNNEEIYISQNMAYFNKLLDVSIEKNGIIVINKNAARYKEIIKIFNVSEITYKLEDFSLFVEENDLSDSYTLNSKKHIREVAIGIDETNDFIKKASDFGLLENSAACLSYYFKDRKEVA